ncbi:unnamed protein product [Enterobius vermicularis]|uniref:Uncharacterized protein n=1 Tax=Enterobius vermicularis TaxID=51028 RepID=A0A0N4VIH8_ENTVE|nr:unnamed protein product [Enterobius vermicularis]
MDSEFQYDSIEKFVQRKRKVGELMATGHLRMHLCLVMKGYIWAWLVFRSRFLLRFGCVHEIAGVDEEFCVLLGDVGSVLSPVSD